MDLTHGIFKDYSGIDDISNYIIDYYKYIIKTTHDNCINYLNSLINKRAKRNRNNSEIFFSDTSEELTDIEVMVG